MIQIACAADDAYVQHTGVMLTSLFETNKRHSFHIHLFSASFSDININTIRKLVEDYNQVFSFYPLDEKTFRDCYVSDHISYATYYRVVIPQHLNPAINKLLYLDTDIIVRRDLYPLWETDIGNNIVGAVPEPSFSEFSRLNISPYKGYFNAGVLIVNTTRWREKRVTQTVMNYINTCKSGLKFWDQDALNANLSDQWTKIPPKWNQQSALFELPQKNLLKTYSTKELQEAMNNPAIIHYTGSSKPWDYLNLHPYKKEYIRYLRKSPWKNYRYPTVTWTKRLQKLIMILIGVRRFQKLTSVFSKR